MKTLLIAGVILGMALAGTTFCGAQETVGDNLKAAGTNISEAAKKVGTEVKEGSVNAALQVKTGAVWVATQVKTGAVKVATEVQDSTGVPLVKDRRTVPELIEQARADTAAGKYRDALNILDRLRQFKLTDEQQKTVNALRAQIQKAFLNSTP